MNNHSKSNVFLALVLAISVAATGCSAQWIIALQDLPVLTQIALNVATPVSTLAAGKQASAADVAVIQNISAQASRDLNLLQTLYGDYQANPSGTKLQKIQDVISDLNQKSAHPAGVGTYFECHAVGANRCRREPDPQYLNSFAALMPQKSPTTSQKVHLARFRIPGT